MTTEVWTVQRVLDWAVADFRKRSFDSPRLDAELLIGRATGLDRVQLIVQGSRVLEAEELAPIRELIRRRQRAEPIAYILGEREFHGLPFRVDPRVLIPRPDTETLVEVALEATRAHSEFGQALDVCTGSGCVGLAFKKQRATWKVTLSDVSQDALDVARNNAERLGLAFGLRFVRSNLFQQFQPKATYALITANPPYIPDEEIAGLAPDIRHFEPRLALAGGRDGLELVRKVVQGARALLHPGGTLAVEIGHDQADRVKEVFSQSGFTEITGTRDYGGHERVISGKQGSAPLTG